MKALILAAGFGTRLKPFTESLPKPLFTIKNISVLDHTIEKVINAGCSSIEINTHHLSELISDYLNSKKYPVPVNVAYETQILETGGAIGNSLSSVSDNLLVVNGDIFFDFDLKELAEHHKKSKNLVTMLLHDYKDFNKIEAVSDFVSDFSSENENTLAFTGIQIVSKGVKKFIPENTHVGIIDIYKKMIDKGYKINFLKKDGYWIDIGTPGNYRKASIDSMVSNKALITQIAGDGSDRKWLRAIINEKDKEKSIVIADHGINVSDSVKEVESFVKIASHLYKKGLNVPEIYEYDFISGIVTVEDLGGVHLADYVKSASDKDIKEIYKKVIKGLIGLSQKGIDGFDSKICWQSERYDKELILEKECGYFFNEFLTGYSEIDKIDPKIHEEFFLLADSICDNYKDGFMHRDFQSKNIMIKDEIPYFIDFQGGRIGPIEYDLASLLIDPYVDLDYNLREEIFSYYLDSIETGHNQSKTLFTLCRITRNLQILGAFSFLSMKKGKKWFEKYIPDAIRSLRYNLENCPLEFPVLKSYVERVSQK